MNWEPPQHWLRIETVDAHTAGEPLRILTAGYPPLPGSTMLAKRRHAMERHDHLRTAAMWEPRGHADMYGCVITEPVTGDGDLGVIFLHNEGYSSMCGHDIIAVTKVGLETGLIPCRRPVPGTGGPEHGEESPDGPGRGTQALAGLEPDGSERAGPPGQEIRIDTPAGRVTAYARWEADRVAEVSFDNVPSFVLALDQEVPVHGVGSVRYDLAFGGAFYAFVEAASVGVSLAPDGFRRLIELGTAIKQAVQRSRGIEHPFEDDLSFLYGVIFVGPAHRPEHHSRNVCVFADGEVDRSPTGTGLSARAALHHARGELASGESFTVESILGTCFTGEVTATTSFGPYDAVTPRITGSAHICGRTTLLIDPEDPLGDGFLLR